MSKIGDWSEEKLGQFIEAKINGLPWDPGPEKSPELPNAMFQGPDGYYNGYALLTGDQLEQVAQGKVVRPSLMVMIQAFRSADQVRDGSKTIAQIPELGVDKLDQSMIYQFMVDNDQLFGTEWQSWPGNEAP